MQVLKYVDLVHSSCVPKFATFPYPQTQALQILEALELHATSYHNDKQHTLYAVQFLYFLS
jgi:hypothetical protein